MNLKVDRGEIEGIVSYAVKHLISDGSKFIAVVSEAEAEEDDVFGYVLYPELPAADFHKITGISPADWNLDKEIAEDCVSAFAVPVRIFNTFYQRIDSEFTYKKKKYKILSLNKYKLFFAYTYTHLIPYNPNIVAMGEF